jgi:hypothetical protein
MKNVCSSIHVCDNKTKHENALQCLAEMNKAELCKHNE